jgi:hypothetical protein
VLVACVRVCVCVCVSVMYKAVTRMHASHGRVVWRDARVTRQGAAEPRPAVCVTRRGAALGRDAEPRSSVDRCCTSDCRDSNTARRPLPLLQGTIRCALKRCALGAWGPCGTCKCTMRPCGRAHSGTWDAPQWPQPGNFGHNFKSKLQFPTNRRT